MCGICGVFDKDANSLPVVEKMLDLLEHRGPDDATSFIFEDYCFGHRRLSIVDLETGRQPIFNEDGTIGVIFNGEIYNHLELRAELIGIGHVFRTESDTEVLVHAYESYGTDFFQRLNGIFAFALLDQRKRELFLVRDHFGIKPLHYFFEEGRLIFASEQKAILVHPAVPRQLNLSSLHSHLNLRYTQRKETLFKGIHRLSPAHYLHFNGTTIQEKRYWSLDPHPDPRMKETDAMVRLNELLKKAVERQLMSDVPLGVYLSGGMDSSAIVQKMSELGVNPIRTFTLGFNEPTDEFPDAEQIANYFKTNHSTLSLSLNPMQQYPRVIWHAEEPKINLLQGFNMSAFVRPHVKVVLGGLGGDELFAGYDIHRFIHPFNNVHRYVPKALRKMLQWKADTIYKLQARPGFIRFDEYRRAVQLLMAIADVERFYLISRNTWDFDTGAYKKIYHPDIQAKMRTNVRQTRDDFDEYFNSYASSKALDQVLYSEFHTKMVNDYLLVEDRMSMANSVEERVPFLDLDLVKFGFSIPVHLKIKNQQTKYLFRKAMQPYLPQRIIKKKKWGFTINPYLQFQKDLKDTAIRVLSPQRLESMGIFNLEYLQDILNHPAHPKLRWHYNYLWVVTGYAILHKMFIETDNFINRKFELGDYYE